MKQLSIGIFGNMNNSPLLVAEGFKSLGHTVKLIVNRQYVLHRPESKYPAFLNNYPDWIIDYSQLTDDDFAYETELVDTVVEQLTKNVDLVILNDTGPSLANRLEVPHVALLTGSDLTYYADYGSIFMRTRNWDSNFLGTPASRDYITKMMGFIERQRQGVSKSQLVCFPHRGFSHKGDWLLDSMGVEDSRRLHISISNTHLLRLSPLPNNKKLVILSPCRIVYRRDSNPDFADMDFKGTDVLLRGFALYCQKGGSGELRLIKKGQDTAAAAALAKELGINHQIVWLDEMSTHHLHQEMTAADLICDQFDTALPGLITTDAYAIGRPVMGNFRNDIFRDVYPEPLPGFDVKTPQDVSDCLITIDSNRLLLAETGRQGRVYAEKYLSPMRSAERLLEQLVTLGGAS